MITFQLKQLLADRKMPQAELARLAKVRPTTVSNMCSNTAVRIRLDYTERICNVLKCDIGDLLKLSDE